MFYIFILLYHLSVTKGSVNKGRNVDNFSVKILVDRYNLAFHRDVDHLNVKISNFTEPLTSSLFICNVTKAIALKTFPIAKERISIFWGCSLFFYFA